MAVPARLAILKAEMPKLSAAKAVIEPDEGDGVLVMLPDGNVVHRAGPAGALATVQSWSAKHLNVVITVEWRGGLVPPERS